MTPARLGTAASWTACARAAAWAALAGCAGAQSRGADGPLNEATPQEQLRVVSSVSWQPLMQRGVEYANQGDLVRAEQYMAAALQRSGPPEQVLPRLLRVCFTAQRYRAGLEYARPYLERHPEAWALQYLVATIHMGLGEPASARARLDLVIRHNPTHAEAEFALGKVLRDDLNDPMSADPHFRRYLELAPQGEHADEARVGLMRQVQN